jgi:hypothetical protein
VVTESVIPATVSFGKVNAQFVMGLKCTNAKNVGKKNVSMNVVTFCPMCTHICSLCSNEVNSDSIVIINCGHNACKGCFENENKPECILCPKARNNVNCFKCNKEYIVMQGGLTSMNCEDCKRKICLGCGGEISLFSFKAHECPFGL